MEFKNPKLYAEHHPDVSRTRNSDGSVTEQELPGFVSVGVELNGVRKELYRFKAGKLLGKLEQASSGKTTGK